MVLLAVLCLIIAAGWLDWTLWLSIPLGYALFAATFWGRYNEALKHKNSAWLVSPLIAWAFMSLGRGIAALIS